MKKILLVDDLGIDVMLTRMALNSFGHPCDIVVAQDGEDAYQLMQDSTFDLLLLDIKMPRVDGFELLERLRHLPPPRTPAIILSGSGLESDRRKAAELGVMEYVQKAVDYSTFKQELHGALEGAGIF
jgi:two-component system, OmpR family, alkaline phosphatase synthesis response regulator PhoP